METREFITHNQIENAVMLCPHLSQTGIEVRANGNRVQISGSVNSFFEKQMAQEAIRQIDGVEQIDNEIEVNWNR